jgi:hypothetical protein
MIVYKRWNEVKLSKHLSYFQDQFEREGWFLFGFIPLYVRDVTARKSLR